MSRPQLHDYWHGGDLPPGGRVAAIDAVGVGGGGAREIVRDVVAACADRAADGSLRVYVSDSELLDQGFSDETVQVVHVPAENYGARLYWWLRGCQRATKQAGCSVVLHMANIGWSGTSTQPSGILVHQALALGRDPAIVWPLRSRIKLWAIRRMVLFSAARATRVFVQSSHIAKMLRSQLKTAATIEVVPPLPPASIKQRHLAVDRERATIARGSGDLHTFAYVGSAAPHKNLSVILAAGAQVDETLNIAFELTVAAPMDSGEHQFVRFLGSLGRLEVATLITKATALVMPSLAETVGLPMLEAMVLRVPVIAADRPYAHEICGQAAHYFDPLDPKDLIRACEEVASSPALRDKLIAQGIDRVEQFRQAQGLERMADWLWAAAAGPPR